MTWPQNEHIPVDVPLTAVTVTHFVPGYGEQSEVEAQPGKHLWLPLTVAAHQSRWPYSFVIDDGELLQSVFCAQVVVHQPPVPVQVPETHSALVEHESPIPFVALVHAPLQRFFVHDKNAVRSSTPPA